MRKLIEAVKAEAQQAAEQAKRAMPYHHEELARLDKITVRAKERMRQCDEALEALDAAARSLTEVGS